MAEAGGGQAELHTLRASVSALDHGLAQLNGKLARQAAALKRIEEGIAKLTAENELSRVAQDARDRRGKLVQELREKYGRHEETRKLADGFIYAVSTGVVDKQVMADTAQQRMVNLPHYWLAPALVAVAAWLSDDDARCREALVLAMHLDRSKTTLFMMLMLRQHDRNGALQQWVDVYLTGLRPRDLPADFSVVIAGVAGGALGDGSAPKLGEWMASGYLAAIRSRVDWVQGLEEWQQRLLSLAPVQDFAPGLTDVYLGWEALRKRHEVNVMIEAAERHFRGRFTADATDPADPIAGMQELVTQLAHTREPEEDRLHKAAELEEIVSSIRDREKAQQLLSLQNAGQSGARNILNLVSRSAFPLSPDAALPAPSVSELLSVVLSRDLIAAACDALHAGTAWPAEIEVCVEPVNGRTCTFTAPADDEDIKEAVAAQAAAGKAKIKAELEGETRTQRDRLRRFARRPLPAAGASVGALVVAAAAPTGVAAVDFALPAAVIVAATGTRLTTLLQRVRMRNLSERDLPQIETKIDEIAGELAVLLEQERRSRQLRTDMQQFLRGLTPDRAYRQPPPADSRSFPRSRGFPDWTPMPPEDRPEISPPDGARSLG